MRDILFIYSARFPVALTYMLQSTEYKAKPYLKWLWRTSNFRAVQHRRTLKRTSYARMLLLALTTGMATELLAGLVFVALGIATGHIWYWMVGIPLIIAYPIVWSHLVIVPLELGRLYIVEPRQNKQIKASAKTFAKHSAIKIAVAGSYGKTTMKEVLKTVLSEGKKVAATEANHNVAIEHAKFARKLEGNEEVLIIEYGEGAPGDVVRFTSITKPTHAVITGLAPAHLDQYKTLDAAAKDIFSLADSVSPDNVYVNADSLAAKPYIRRGNIGYSVAGAGDWKARDIKIEVNKTSFNLVNEDRSLKLTSRLLGKHQVGVLAAAALIAMQLGLSDKQIITGIANTAPFDHRMQPYKLGGAWIIDDTYNGNIDGIKAGTMLLKELKATRKIYVTPGLVDQGKENIKIHQQMGRYIAAAKPDVVILMQNSTTDSIKQGLIENDYVGELKIETDPLAFYTNLDQFAASGDLVMMQNDWPDNYA